MTREEVETELVKKYEAGNYEFKRMVLDRLIVSAKFENLVQINNSLHMCKDCAETK